jgi:tetratricopeptide (TPR) repeat protein/predicted TPR repeat methyltransferase
LRSSGNNAEEAQALDFGMSKVKLTRRRLWTLLAIIFACILCGMLAQQLARSAEDKSHQSEKRALNEREAAIEAASFARAEFFGAQALVPFPTAEARNRLAGLLEKYGDEPQIFLRLSQLDEKLGRFAESERELQRYVELQSNKPEALEILASFFDRRAQFEKEAATFEHLLDITPPERSPQIFARLIELARTHRLENYLKPEFYQKYIERGAASFEIIEQLLDKLTEEKNYTEALTALRQYKDRYLQRQSYLLEKEVSILVALKKDAEAESVYQKAFDPFWSQSTVHQFYEFLSDHDRLRAYGHELSEAFKRKPTDFQVALRLIHYRNYRGETTSRIITQLEQARAARSVTWQPEELATIARLLIADGDGDTAARFLYTLHVQNELKPGSPLRAKVLYQLFELLSDAKDEKLALTRGDLKFYQDIATSDPHPGMLGGVLSLILSDTDPAAELATQERAAVRYFNRAAAFRVFKAYKQEYPTAPELAQMYLDIVRLYAASAEPQVAAETLQEFEQRYEDAPRYAEVALKLADCYITLNRYADERAVYQRVLDNLGKKRAPGEQLVPALGQTDDGEQAAALNINSEPTEIKPSVAAYPPQSNRGIDLYSVDAENATTDSDYSKSRYTDYLTTVSAKPPSNSAHEEDLEDVTYASVLERYVASLAREKRNDDILALYTNEMKKYPDEQGLYEQMLEWLGQTNLLEEQLKVYKEALQKFPTTVWRDRLARWYIRRERKEEFESYSRQLLGQLGDQELQNYLKQFIGANSSANPASFDAQLYLGLYTLAHERFPHNLDFVRGLLKFYSAHDRFDDWRKLMAEYYFVSREIRDEFLAHLASRNELRSFLDKAREQGKAQAGDEGARVLDALPYKLFRADAAAHLANYEEAIDAYRELNRLYPNTPEFAERLISFTRSLGERNPKFLEEAAAVSHALAEAFPASREYRTRAGEIQAELGDYDRARGEWEQLIQTGRGVPDTYLETATVYWDYFQYEDALRTILKLREQLRDARLYAFQAGAILEAAHKPTAALGEYIKALDYYGTDDDGVLGEDKAKRRLVKLYKRAGVPAQLQQAFERERQRRSDSSSLVLDYADLLSEAGEKGQAAALLKQEIARNDSREFLTSARNILETENDRGVGQLALRRLVAVTKTPRFAISYRLQLAADAEQRGNRREAQVVLHELVASFPTNYGVLNEADGLYWRMGLREDALRVLEDGVRLGKGRFSYIFGRKLATRLTLVNRLPEAERVLTELHAKDKLNTEVFHELARIYLRTSNTVALKRAFQETLAAINAQDLDRRELHAQASELRKQMIDAFTRLKDYRAGIEQHIEIINREPDDEENVEAAINYARRYGGADTLLDYYQRTARTAYKNYRWNVVLARIYEAKNDLQSAAQNYKAAIANQPEMVELYDALADVYTRMKSYEAALEALNHAAELTNDDPQYIRRKVEVLLQAGRRREAEEERQKLPDVVVPKRETVGDEFAEASRMRSTEKSKAVATYREAFNTLLADPLAHELKAAEITGYVQTVRDEESLDKIAERLWQLRDKLIQEAERKDSTRAGAARDSLKVLDGALPEAVGQIASERATGDELSALFADFNRRIEVALSGNDMHETLALLQNLSHRSGFGALEEKILIAQKETAHRLGSRDLYRQRLQGLVEFYTARGAYRQVVELMEAERAREVDRDSSGYILNTLAENARLVGDHEKELQALRESYRRLAGNSSNQASGNTDEVAGRYFEALYENGDEGKAELRELAQTTSPYQFQLINFLLAHGMGDLAHEAIERAPLNEAWKLSRHAGASLALQDYRPQNETYFADALQLKSIGELVAQKPDAAKQLVGDDWFRLALAYGQWLSQSQEDGASERGRRLLPAMIESRPQDEGEQAKLGRLLLERKDYKGALEHLELALEMNPQDNLTRAAFGSVLFLSGDKAKALQLWAEIIRDKQPDLQNCELYLRTLRAQRLASEARAKLFPLLVEQLAAFGDDENNYPTSSYGEEREKQLASLQSMIRALADSFREEGDDKGAGKSLAPQTETARAEFFYKLSEAVKSGNLLPQMLIKESLIAREHFDSFYQLLIKRSSPLNDYERDYDYAAKLSDTWGADEAEKALDQENNYKISEPSSDRLSWQKEYLNYLIARHQLAAARNIIKEVEAEISRRYVRPIWLRLASLRLDILEGGEAKALAELRRFVGIEGASSAAVINAPSLERLNMAVAMLRNEGRNAQADELLEAAYTRELALENYGTPAFVGLARLAFGRGDEKLGLKLLHVMVALSDNETRAAAAADLASWPNVKAYAADGAKQEVSEMESALDQKEALRLAAETASAFGEFEAGINYRQQLFVIAPEDETNHLELVQLLAEHKDYETALNHLAHIISDRTASRRGRWQAVWLASMIVGERDDLWAKLKEQVRASGAHDAEMLDALDALSLSNAGHAEEAIKLIRTKEAANPNPYLNFFGALLEKRGQGADAQAAFIRTLVAKSDEKASEAFWFEENPLRQIIRFYASQGEPRAALLASELEPTLKESNHTERDEQVDSISDNAEDVQVNLPESTTKNVPRYQTLRERVAERESKSRLELLGLLSEAAEQVGDFSRAVEFERARLRLLPQGTERQIAEARVNQLLSREKESVRRAPVTYKVDQSLIASR